MNDKNLIPLNKRSKAKKKEIARRGGIASGISRNKNKDFKQLIKEIGKIQIQDTKAKAKLKSMGLDTDVRNYIFLKVYENAVIENNPKALFKLFDTFLNIDFTQLDGTI